MPNSAPSKPASAFDASGIKSAIDELVEEIRALYLLDEVPWVVGYSGGKDSTAVLQLTWMAVSGLPVEKRHKPVHVISTDTLVENPIVASWVSHSLKVMAESAESEDLPIKPHRLTPTVQNSFWVNLLGKGYPAPRHKFRWCTERLKIMPSNAFINDVVQTCGEVILLLGTRKAESVARAKSMAKHEAKRLRARLSPNASLPNSQIYSPVEDWSNDDVWLFLMQYENPWGYNNKDLLTMYQGATQDGECPLVVDTTTPSCGDSRFGCWVCTMVSEDRSMRAMIQNDGEKHWMLPLLKFRDRLAVRNDEGKWDDRSLRDWRRLAGNTTLHNGRLVHGPYTQATREEWLKELLLVQKWLAENGPAEVSDAQLITLAELEEIRRIWVVDKHEIEDLLPQIYEESLGQEYPGVPFHQNGALGKEELSTLRDICEEDGGEAGTMLYQLLRGLLDVEQRFRTMSKRKGLYGELERVIRAHQFGTEEAALESALKKRQRQDANERKFDVVAEPTPNHEPSAEDAPAPGHLPFENHPNPQPA